MRIRLTIFNKGLVLIAIPLLWQLLFIFLVSRMLQGNTQEQWWVMHTKKVIAQTHVVQGTLAEAEASVRGLTVTGDPAFAEDYERAVQKAPEEFALLQELVGDNPEQIVRAAAAAEKASRLMSWLAEMKRLVTTSALDQVALRAKSRAGKTLMVDCRQALSSFRAEEERLESERQLNVQRSQRQLQLLLYGGSAVAILLTLVLALAFRRGIVRRLAMLTENAQRLAQGKELLPAVVDTDEIAQVDEAFHRMAWQLASSDKALRTQSQILQRFNEELEHRVAERTRELTAANRSLAQKNQENELFVYSVSHDLRSPLVNLEGFGEELGLVCQDLRRLLEEGELPAGLRERALALLDGDMSEAIRFIRAGVRRLSNIIDGLLRLSRAGRVEHHCRSIDIKPILTRVVDSLHATIVERQAAITVADLPAVWADAGAVEQIFANVIGNALNYLAPGRPGVIEIGTIDAPSQARGAGQTAVRTFYVKDNGLGIPAAYQPKIFQAFQRLHPAAAKGEGIGLTLVRRLIERLGGSIWFESTESVGSTFFVTLPEAPANGTPQRFRPDAAITQEAEQTHDDGAVLHSVG